MCLLDGAPLSQVKFLFDADSVIYSIKAIAG